MSAPIKYFKQDLDKVIYNYYSRYQVAFFFTLLAAVIPTSLLHLSMCSILASHSLNSLSSISYDGLVGFFNA
jgi:hypothetical protein